jgi:hypothetical protein
LHSMNLSTLWALTWLYAAWLSPENWNYSAHSLRKGNWVQNEYKFIKVYKNQVLQHLQAGNPGNPFSHLDTFSHSNPILESLRPQSNRLQEKINENNV